MAHVQHSFAGSPGGNTHALNEQHLHIVDRQHLSYLEREEEIWHMDAREPNIR